MTIRATRLTPGTASEAWLDRTLAELKGADPLGPLTVVVPGNYAGLALRRRLAARGYANVRHSVLARLAEMAGAPSLAAQSRVPLTAITEEAAIRAALRKVGGIGPQTEHRAVITTLQALFRDLVDGGIENGRSEQLSSRGELARVAMAAHAEFRRSLAENGLYDRADVLRAATAAIEAEGGRLLADWGPIVLYLPSRLSAPELKLIAALGGAGTVDAGLPWLDDAVADAEPRRWVTSLGLDWDALPGERPAEGVARPEVLMAPDAGEEVRAAVRRVLADLESQRVPLHRTALVYRHSEPYQQLVRETLDAARLRWVGLGGRPISDSFAGRGLLGLLHLQGQRFSRSAVLNWLSSLPHGGEGPSLAQWDRISRRAGIVRGVEQWTDRLQRKLAEDRARIEKLEKEDEDATEPLRNYLRSEAAATEEMARRVEEMDRLTRPPRGHTWEELSKWAVDLRARYIRPGRSWTPEQVEAAQMVDETVAGLAAAVPFDSEVEVERFVETLEQALAARRRPVGRLGQGVVTGSIASIAGMSFDRVYLLGMSERAYPAAPPVDPIFPDDSGEDPIGRESRRLASERMSYLGALAAGGRAVLCCPTHDTAQRPAYPSRWLLDAVAELAGERVGPAQLRELRGSAERPWLTSLVSTEAALRHGPVMLNLPERRVNEAREIAKGQGSLLHSALAGREELPLGRALIASGARASHEFTEFDGNVGSVAGGLTKLAGGLSRLHPISASGVETWAGCPFRYFLGRVLEVEPTERPEDDEAWAISAIDRGSLIHAILEEFFGKLREAGRPAIGEEYTQADRELLQDLARRHFQRVESLGQTGYRLAWLNEQTAIMLDLGTVLTKDEEFRARLAIRPQYFEQGFGWAEGWPAAEVALADGTVVRLRGYIDRVDLGDGEAYVTDYKTGSNYKRKEFEDDPVVAGTKVQLAVYSNAVRRFLESEGRPAGQVTASYWFISTKGNFSRVEVSDPLAADQRLAEIMGVVNEGLTAGAFPQVPGEDQGGVPKRPAFSNCVFCDYHRVCPTGRDQIRERKKDQPGAALHQRLALS